jgi:hypothetical protein
MAAPTVASTTPVNGSADFDGKRNSLTAVFDTALLASSVSRQTVYLYETTTGRPVDKEVTLDSTGKTITVIPKAALKEEVQYTWSLVGADLNAPGGHIKSSGGDALASIYTVVFRTAAERFVSREEIMDRSDVEIVGPIRDVEDEAAATGFISPITYTPAAFASNQRRTLDTIEVDFGEAVATTGSLPALSVTMGPSDGYTRDYGHEDTTGKFLMRDVEGSVPSRVALISDPVGTVSADGTKLVWTKSSSYVWPYNAEITVQVHADRVVNTSGWQMSEDLWFIFTTEYWPVYATPMVIRIELGATVSQLYDDTIYRIIYKNSIAALLHSGDNLGPSASRDYVWGNVERYVKAQTIIDVIAHLRLLADMQAGQKKQLGDFTVQYTANDPSFILKVKEATADRDRALRELRRYRGLGGPRTYVKAGSYADERQDFRMRSWDSVVASSVPTANTLADRGAKRDLRTDHDQLSARARRLVVSEDQEIFIDGAEGTSVLRC